MHNNTYKKRNIILIILTCFIGQLLVGCNNGSNLAISTKSQITSLAKQENIDATNKLSQSFDEMNSDQDVWANVTLSDIAVI